MKIRYGEIITQKSGHRGDSSNGENEDGNDKRDYSVGQYTIIPRDVSTWLVAPSSIVKSGGRKQVHVTYNEAASIPEWLGKILVVTVHANNRTMGTYEHSLPHHKLDSDNDRGLVSKLVRHEYCHTFVMRVLGLLPVLPGHDSVNETAIEMYNNILFTKKFREQKKGEAPYERIKKYYKHNQEKLPSVCRIHALGHLDHQASPSAHHSFIILGMNSSGELLCAEKINSASMPYRICTIEDISDTYSEYQANRKPGKYLGGTYEWQVMSLDQQYR
jgi:hypothetical protein